MPSNEWKSTGAELPPSGQDVLVYSATANGYAVAVTRMNGPGVVWLNSTNGMPFMPAPTHWRLLPEPPLTGTSGYESDLNN